MSRKLVSSLNYMLRVLFEDSGDDIIQQPRESKLDAILRSKLMKFNHVLEGLSSDILDTDGCLTSLVKYGDIVQNLECTVCFQMQQKDGKKRLLETDDVRTRFTAVCLAILSKFNLDTPNKVTSKDSSAASTSEMIIGVKDQKFVLTALQFIIGLGISPNLLPGIGIPLLQRTGYNTFLELSNCKNLNDQFLFLCTQELCKIATNCIIGKIIVTKCLGDIFSSLIQLGFKRRNFVNGLAKNLDTEEGKRPVEHDIHFKHDSMTTICDHQREWCRNELESLLNRTYQPIVIRELLFLQGFFKIEQRSNLNMGDIHKPPKWFICLCGKLLSNRLLEKNGVMFILDALFDGCSIEEGNVHMKFDIVGRLLATCPSQAKSLKDYYGNVSDQILHLLELNAMEANVKHLYNRVLSHCISWMMIKDLNLTQECLLNKLFYTFEIASSSSDKFGRQDIIEEETITKSVEMIHKIFIQGSDPKEHMVTFLSGFIHPIFGLYCFLRNSASHLKLLVKEMLLWLIHNSTQSVAEKMLVFLLFNNKDIMIAENCWRIMSPDVIYIHGHHGGAVLIKSPKPDKHYLHDGTNDNTIGTDLKIVGMLDLIISCKDNELVGNFFVYLMECLSSVIGSAEDFLPKSFDSAKVDKNIEAFRYKILLIGMIVAMCDKLETEVLVSPKQIVSFLKTTLQRLIVAASKEEETENILKEDFKAETLNMALWMLSFICSNVDKSKQEDYRELQEFLPLIERIGNMNKGKPIENICNDLRISIATHDVFGNVVRSGKKKPKGLPREETYDAAMEELFDPLVPIRGHALIQLSHLIEERDKKTLDNIDKLLNIFMDNLCHDDTYIYLAAIQGLVSLSDIKHEIVIPYLAKEFAMFGTNCSVPNSNQKREGTVEGKKQRSPEIRMKMGEVLIKACQRCGPLLPKYSQLLLSALLTGVKDSDGDVRASSLSSLGDACKVLRFSLGSCIHEILSCISNVVQCDPKDNVRQAALLVFTSLLKGLTKDVFQLIGTELKDIYRLLKLVQSNEKNDMIRHHAERALGELDSIMIEFLFPLEKMQKKIQVIGES